ncbi:hypothetical protein SKAU_G00038620 [Synaphobranchus kaupii]|uniref:Major facilitator superfamily (MFS) profile domain-containing protein n=1 Tax=Synaphobranchus kaupii TaxID=118154 RepID=A0A9Q1JHM8_SYNKA|nr:hypothetical protein SKAU_G00038620 [Synaphobranchus kaupii]
MRDCDEISLFLGEWGPFQKSIFILLSLSIIPNGYGGMSMMFLSDTPHHHCSLPYLNSTGSNLSQALPLEEVNGQLDYSRCTRYTRLNSTEAQFSNETERCLDGWDYSTEQYISTITTEWNLVCGDVWKVPFSRSVFFMGVLAGSFVSGHISDRFGRKSVFFLSTAVIIICSLIQVVSLSWEMFVILYFINGMGQISQYISAFILGNELLGESSRLAFSTLGMCVFYALGYAVLPLCAYFIRSWRILLLVLTLPGFLYIPLWWFIPESPRWLLAQGRHKEAEDIVRAAAKKNGVTPPNVFLVEDSANLENNTDHPKRSYTYLDLVRTNKMRNITIINIITWFSVATSFFGLSLNTPNMNGDLYVNCLLSAVVELAAYTGAWLLLKVASRRAIMSSTLLIGGTVLLLIQIVPEKFSSFSVGLAMVGKLGVTTAYSVVYISTTELYPTVVRGMGVGVCSMSSKMGSVIAPFLAFMGTYNKALPYIVMGLLTLAVGLLSLLLPETRGIALPEDLSQVQPLNCCCYRGEPAAEPEAFKEDQLPAEDGNVQMN